MSCISGICDTQSFTRTENLLHVFVKLWKYMLNGIKHTAHALSY